MAQRGRPRKINNLQEKIMSSTSLPKVHHIVRYLSKTGGTVAAGAFSIKDTDEYLSSWLDQGYELFSTHFVGENPEGFGVIYILVRKDA